MPWLGINRPSRSCGHYSTARSAVYINYAPHCSTANTGGLTLPPLNLEPDELLDAVVERLLKAMRSVRPQTVRQFFALVNQHMR